MTTHGRICNLCNALFFHLQMEESNPILDFLEVLEDKVVIMIVPGDKIKDTLVMMIRSSIDPPSGEQFMISIEEGYEVEYTRYCRKIISTKLTAKVIKYLREEQNKDPNQVRVLVDPFGLLSKDKNFFPNKS